MHGKIRIKIPPRYYTARSTATIRIGGRRASPAMAARGSAYCGIIRRSLAGCARGRAANKTIILLFSPPSLSLWRDRAR